MRLREVLNQVVFGKVKLLHEVLRNGVMDYLIDEDEENLAIRLNDFNDSEGDQSKDEI